MADARFEDGDEAPMRLVAQGPEDVPVLSALVQDAVLTAGDLSYDRRRRRFALLLNRFRWEDRDEARRQGRAFERVRSLLTVEDVLTVRTNGISPSRKDEVLSLLALDFVAGVDGAGKLRLTFAGDGALELQVEALELRLDDVTKPYLAPSRREPGHGG